MDSIRGKRNTQLHLFSMKKGLLILLILMVGITSTPMTAEVTLQGTNTTAGTTPDVKIIDASAVMDVSQIGDVTLGQIPDERISVTTSVVNTGTNKVSGLRIKTFLVKEGREDAISTQLGSDFRNVELGPGEVKSFKNNYVISKNIKPGNYKIMTRIDSDVTGKEKNSPFIQYISDQIIKIGAYADAGGYVPVYSPNSIDTPGSYLLMRDVQGGDRNTIFKIACSDVTFDGGGHTIQGIPSGFTSAIYVDGGNQIQNVVIKNCIFDNVDFGVWFYRVDAGSVINCTFKNCKNLGIRLDQSRTNTISDNYLTDNTMGIGVFQSSGNKITNNFLKNQFNAAANDDQRNFWSTEPQDGTNIAGGNVKGGNVWLDPNGSGFSITTPDMNHDGIVENPYSINGNNIDYYPLAGNQAESQPSPTTVPDQPSNSSDSIPGIIDAPLAKVSVNTTSEFLEILPEQITNSSDSPTGNTGDTSGKEIRDNSSSEFQENIPVQPTIASEEKFVIEGSADLVISDLNSTESSCITSEFPITSVIENNGDIDASFFSIHFYLSDDQGITPADKEIGYHEIRSLKPHEKLNIADTLHVPYGTGMKNYSIGAIVDPSNDIYEQNKSNNIAILNHRIQIKDC